jgi:predicted nucleic acid-binding protein
MTHAPALAAGPVALDTAVFIYYIEEHPDYLPFVEPLFAEVDAGTRDAVTSALTLLEVLVVAYRAGDVALAERYERLLTRSRGLHLVDLDRRQLRTAAQLRALYRLRTPDALQIAAALTAQCQTFVTNDRELPEIPGLRVVQLDQLRQSRRRR